MPYDFMRILQSESHRVGVLVFAIVIAMFHGASLAGGDVVPLKRLAFYYGFPSAVNEARGSLDRAIDAYDKFDLVVFGDTIEFPQFKGAAGQVPDFGCTQNSHRDHDNAQAIIDRLQAPGGHTQVFGYVSIGGENTYRRCSADGPPVPLTLGQIKERINMWADMKVTGVFFDEAEYGFGEARERCRMPRSSTPTRNRCGRSSTATARTTCSARKRSAASPTPPDTCRGSSPRSR